MIRTILIIVQFVFSAIFIIASFLSIPDWDIFLPRIVIGLALSNLALNEMIIKNLGDKISTYEHDKESINSEP